MPPPSPDARALTPPPAPPQNHRELRAQLPPFPFGAAADRLERARDYLRRCRTQIEGWHRAGASGLSICRVVAESLDRLVRGLFEELRGELQPPQEIALAALGGYGRRETAPFSDLDLLLLRGPKAREDDVRPFAKDFNTLLWDLKLVVGWSVRTPDECARAAEDDHTVRTALLDCRLLTGDAALFDALSRKVLRELLTHKADAFIADKSAELRARREKFGDTIFLLEPQIKQGEGGLRDLEGALWIAQARYRTRGLRELLKEGVLPASEVRLLTDARDFLMRIRNHLHLSRGRKEDRLTFELQEQTAHFLGYRDRVEGLAVEQFMRDTYLSMQVIRRAAEALVARCEETIGRRSHGPERRLGPFKVFRGKLTLDSDAAPLSEAPANVLRLFHVSDAEGLELYSWARDQVTQAVSAVAEHRGDPEVVDTFKQLFARPGTRGELLFELHGLGVLGAVLPEFGRITARHQHDLYHVYTVDIHSLFAVQRLYAVRAGDLLAEEPLLSRAMGELEDPLPLYLGMLLHDCGKGMGGDHSENGRVLARQACERLGMSPRQSEITEFLVLHHLSMSRTSQRRDLSDPGLIADFARACGDVEKLNCLYLLTYADMACVAPGMWNEWKAQLLHELYQKTRAQLLGEAVAGPSDGPSARDAFKVRWTAAFGSDRAQHLTSTLPERYFLQSPDRATRDARLLQRAQAMPLSALVLLNRRTGVTELSLAARDRPGLLALFAGVLSAHRIDIHRAQITSSDDGLALDAFDVSGPQGKPLDRTRWRAARADLWRVLQGSGSVEEILRKRRPGSLLRRAVPRVETKVSLDNRASQRFSVIDVRTQDRMGLLYAVASALHEAGVEIALAKIATEANRAIDSFYVTRGGAKIADGEETSRLIALLHRAAEEVPDGAPEMGRPSASR